MIGKCAERLGYGFIEAGTGEEALRLLQKYNGNVRLIVIEWHMSKEDGVELMKNIKEHSEWAPIPVTVTINPSTRTRVKRAIENGARNILVKPFSEEVLIDRVLEGLGTEF
jgi:CheY-like chemotaxis protein